MKGGIWTVFNSFQPTQQYSISRQRFENGELRKNVKVTVFVILSLALLSVCLTPFWIYLCNGSNFSEKKSDHEILRQHRKNTEALVEGWIHDVYKLQNDTGKGNTTSVSFDVLSQRGYIMQEIVREFAILKNASLLQLKSTDEHQSTFHAVVKDICPSETLCNDETARSPYRTFDGSCNNLFHPEWGMTRRPQRRLLPAMYSDDFGTPRMYGYHGNPLPSPRIISNIVHSPTGMRRTDEQTTVMVMAFGQFLSHDIVSTPMMDGHHSSVLKCCEGESLAILSGPFKACFPIDVSKDDNFFTNSKCMSFTRSAPAVCEKCEVCGRDQVNEMTSYIDASQVYGASTTASRQLRTFHGGLMLSNEKGLLPQKVGGSCKVMSRHQYCFNAGDGRVNVVPNLSTIHTAFVRLHNQMAQTLSEINPHWDDEKLYQETRKILIAIMQNIAYNEYLPIIIGKGHMDIYNLSTGSDFESVYDSSVDASASNGFNTASFRFGHMTVPDNQISLNDRYEQECISRIEKTYHNPNLTFLYCDGLTRWLVHRKGLKSDGLFSNGVRNLLFLNERNVSFDLVALNIQRGRDHGLPPYNHYRKFCKLPTISEDEFKRNETAMGNFAVEDADLFRKVYRHPDDIDLFSGGVKEKPLPGAQVGPTFACMIADEFRRLKTGDRFYFENPKIKTGFTISQLTSIKSLSFAKILCETMHITEVQPLVFRPVSQWNQLKQCQELTNIELELWKEVRE